MKKLAVAALCLALVTACAHQAPPRNPMATWVPSPNFDERRPVVIVLHYTEQESAGQSLHTLRTRNSGGPVSSHYLVGDDGAIYQLVADGHRAWHAGGGRWGTITDLNSASIGIEIDNNGREPFTEPQVQALLRLLDDLTTRLRIPRSQVIGHSDLAPTRKIDPGALFPWRRLAEAGFGIWPADDAPPAPQGFDAMRALEQVGYDTGDPEAVVRAFRLRFRGDASTELDAEDLRILHALTLPEGMGLLKVDEATAGPGQP